MKAAILSVADPRALAATSIYTSYFDKNGIEYDVICANRYGRGNTFFTGKLYQYDFEFEASARKISKLRSLLGFRDYALDVLRSNDYDFIVIWNENTMLLFSDVIPKLGISYTANFRDLDFVRNPLFDALRRRICKRAIAVTAPSRNVPSFMQDYRAIQLVSLQPDLPVGAFEKTKLHCDPICISYIGTFQLDYVQAAQSFMKALGNDSRFFLRYIGTGTEVLREFVNEMEFTNIEVRGTFAMDEIGEILNQADIVNSYYGPAPYIEYLLMSIKMGYAIRAKIPLIVGCEATEVADSVERYGIGFVLDGFESLGDKLYEWYTNLNYQEYSAGCEKYIDDINKINGELYKRLDETLLK